MDSFDNLFPLPNHYTHHHHHQGRFYSGSHHVQTSTSSTQSCPDPSPRTPTEPMESPFASTHATDGGGSPYSSSPKNWFLQKVNNHHHHHSLHELIKHFGKKMHHWKSEGERERRSSCSEDSSAQREEFRHRSKSLDGDARRNIGDCETTYRIYNRIIKEGNFS